MGSVASAMSTFRRTLKNFENTPDVYNYYGELLLDQQKFQEAIDNFDKAVELERSSKPWGINVLPLINKALALFQWKHDFQEAEALCEKALISKHSHLYTHSSCLLTDRPQSTLNAISPSQPSPNFCSSKERSPKP